MVPFTNLYFICTSCKTKYIFESAYFVCVGVVYSGEYDVCDVTLSTWCGCTLRVTSQTF